MSDYSVPIHVPYDAALFVFARCCICVYKKTPGQYERKNSLVRAFSV